MRNLALLFLILFSCETKVYKIENEYQLKITSPKYEIYLDHLTSSFELASQYLPVWRGEEAFAFLNRKNNEIKIYQLNTGLLSDSIQYQKDGPNGVGRIYEFHIHNEDSIFLNSKFSYRIYLINQESKILNQYYLLPKNTEFGMGGIPKGSSQTALPSMPIWHPPTLIDHFLYINSSADRDIFKPEYYDSELIYRLNLQTGEYDYLIEYAEKYKGNVWGVGFESVYSLYNKNNYSFIFSFPIEDHIYETRDFNSFEKHVFKSSLVPEVKPMSKPTNEFSIYYKYFKSNSAYGSILYDPNRKVYFRIANLKIEDDNYNEPTNALSNPQDFVVIVSDDSFNLIHEERFKQPKNGQYVPRMSFVNKTGLNIAFIDYDNEDKLTFVNFKLEKNDSK